MQRTAHATVLSLLSLLLVPLPASGQAEICTLDQVQEITEPGHRLEPLARWQEFTPTRGTVCELGFHLGKFGAPGDVRVRVMGPEATHDGSSSGSVALWSTVLPAASLHDGWNHVTPGSGIPVIAGRPHQLLLSLAEWPPTSTDYYHWSCCPSDVYAGGESDGAGDYAFEICTRGPVWKVGPPLPDERIDAAAILVNGRIVLTGGSDSWLNYTESAACYELFLDEFGPAGDWLTIASLNEARRYHSLSCLGFTLFAVSGYGNGECLGSIEKLGASGTWAPLPISLPADLLHTTWILGGRLYIAGTEEIGETPYVRSVAITAEPDDVPRGETAPSRPRWGADAVVLGNQIFLIGGYEDPGHTLPVLMIERSTILPNGDLDVWETAGELPRGVTRGEALAVIGSRVVVLGNEMVWLGEMVTNGDELELGNWTDLGVMPGGIEGRMTAVVEGPRLYVLGGEDSSGGLHAETWYADLGEFLTEGVAFSYGKATANSGGTEARIGYSGSLSLSEQAGSSAGFHLEVTGCPADQIGFFFCGTASARVDLPFSDGRRLVGGRIARFPVSAIGGSGCSTRELDVLDNIAGLGPAEALTTWYFQMWYRDPGVGMDNNFSNALSVTFGM